MRIAASILLFAAVGLVTPVFSAQSNDDAAPVPAEGSAADVAEELREKLLGAWVLEPKAESGLTNTCLKFWGERHWTISTYSPDGDIISHHGGTYAIDGNKYSETVEYAAELTRDWALGKTFHFTITVDGDTYTQQGINNKWHETWKRLKQDVPTAKAEDKDIERWRNSTWQIAIGLDTPNLVPPAVQWTVLDEDPIPGCFARLEQVAHHRQKRDSRTNNEAATDLSQLMTVSWNLGFKEVTGDKVYLLTTAPGRSHMVSSNASGRTKWIATKIAPIQGKSVCWCFPIEVESGKETQVTLTEDNTFDLKLALLKEALTSGRTK